MTDKETIGVSIIARNAEPSIGECISSVEKYVDQVVVVLAGESTDKTAEVAKQASEKTELYDFEWCDDFSAARNYALSKMNTDWIMWVDSDDVVENADQIPGIVANTPSHIAAIWLPYFYAFDDCGNTTTLFDRERIMRKKIGWVWRGRVHETVAPLNNPVNYAKNEDVKIIHKHMDIGGSRSERNFKLLNLMHLESPEDRRVWMYLGFQHFAGQSWEEATEWFMKFVACEDVLPIEKYQCLTYAGRAMREAGRFKDAINCDLLAVELYPNWADAYIGLCMDYNGIGQFDKAITWGESAKTKSPPDRLIFVNPLDYAFNLPVSLSTSYIGKMDMDNSINCLKEANKVRPKDTAVTDQIKKLEIAKFRKQVTEGVDKLSTSLALDGEWLKVEKIREVMPEWLKWDNSVSELNSKVKQRIAVPMPSEKISDKQKEVISILMDKYGTGIVLYDIELSKDPQKILDIAEMNNDVVYITTGHNKKSRLKLYSEKSLEELLTSKQGREILTIHKVEDDTYVCCYRKGVPKTKVSRIFTGKGLEEWNPISIMDSGCGGSETWAAMVAGGLQNKGQQVILHGAIDGAYDGVIYRDSNYYKPATADIFISSRVPGIFEQDVPANHKILWFHDVHRGAMLTGNIASEVEYIVALSKWHTWYLKQCYPFLKDCEIEDYGHPAEFVDDGALANQFNKDDVCYRLPKMAVIGNGIHTSLYEKLDEKKEQHRFIWASSPDRGLFELLQDWHVIKKEFSDAELHIFYGWEYYDHSLFIPEQRKLKQDILRLLNQDGVNWRGRIGQRQLAQEFKKAEVWYYPLHFSDIFHKDAGGFRETYCITAVEAQAAECLCVARASGGLGETVGDRGILLPLDKPEKRLELLFNVLYDRDRKVDMRSRGREWAMQQTWDKVVSKILHICKEE